MNFFLQVSSRTFRHTRSVLSRNLNSTMEWHGYSQLVKGTSRTMEPIQHMRCKDILQENFDNDLRSNNLTRQAFVSLATVIIIIFVCLWQPMRERVLALCFTGQILHQHECERIKAGSSLQKRQSCYFSWYHEGYNSCTSVWGRSEGATFKGCEMPI